MPQRIIPPLTNVSGQPTTIVVQRIAFSLGIPYISFSIGATSTVAVGQNVTFADVVTNTGCLSETISATESKGDALSIVGGNPIVPVGGSVTLNASRIITAADQTNPQITFMASALGVVNGVVNNALSFGPVTSPTLNLTITAPATLTPSAALFSITKTANVTSVTPGQDITFTITITNTSGSTLTGITLTDNVPTDTMTVKTAASDVGSATNSGNNITGIVTLTTGQVAHITITATVLATVKSPTIITNAATASINGANSLSASVNVPLATTSGGTGGTAGVLPTTGGGSPDVQSLFGLFGLVAAGVVALSAFGVLRRVRR